MGLCKTCSNCHAAARSSSNTQAASFCGWQAAFHLPPAAGSQQDQQHLSSEWQAAPQPHPPVKNSRHSTHGPTMHTSRALLRAATLPRSARVEVQQLSTKQSQLSKACCRPGSCADIHCLHAPWQPSACNKPKKPSPAPVVPPSLLPSTPVKPNTCSAARPTNGAPMAPTAPCSNGKESRLALWQQTGLQPGSAYRSTCSMCFPATRLT